MNEEINKVVKVLQEGGIILYPTDTIWGIGCDATNRESVKRIYDLKKRVDSKAMIVLIDTEQRLGQCISEVPEIAWQLLQVADKPLTIIYPGAKNLADNLIAENGSIGIRIVQDEFCRNLIHRFKKPIVSTSANISGEKSPSIFTDISNKIIRGVDYVVRWRQNNTDTAKPSSILELGLHGEIKIIRS
ncbi:MAG: threonylcarbamoyl-AMP synthase [Bacteroidales bacterium]|nr:threonylcarbamoyl-AMP synthase [Bacteroidales bacterium]